MKLKIVMLFVVVLSVLAGQGQLIKSTIKPGGAGNDVDLFITPDFDNSTEILFQLQFVVAFPATANPLPSGITVTLSPSFVTNFVGSTYSMTIYPMSNNTGNTEKYFSILLTRNAGSGAANSAPQTWVHATEYPVLNVKFNSGPTPAALAQVKVADYQDQGADLNGNTFTVNGTGTYYYDFITSSNNFYGVSGVSTAGGTAAAGFAQTVSLISLPVQLLNFSGYKNGSKNTLNWTVTSEVNNRGFDVQRSTNGISYSSIGFVNTQAPGGFSNSEQHYSFDDINPTGNKQYYRLVQQDIDGHSKQSNVVMITGERATVLGIGGLFPNPTRDQLNVQIDAPQQDRLVIVITDMTGKIAIQQQANVNIGSNTIPVGVSKLASGSYLVKLKCQSSDCESASSKFNKE